MNIKYLIGGLVFFCLISTFSLAQKSGNLIKHEILNRFSDFTAIFLQFPSEYLHSPYSDFTGAADSNYGNRLPLRGVLVDSPTRAASQYFDSDLARDEIINFGGTTLDLNNYAMTTTYPCETQALYSGPGDQTRSENCINNVGFAVWKSLETQSIYAGIAETINIPKLHSTINMYVYRNDKWTEVSDFPTGSKILPGILARKFPQIAKKQHLFRYILPMRGTIIRVAVTWSDTNDYNMPQLLDVAYIKLVKGKWVFQAL